MARTAIERTGAPQKMRGLGDAGAIYEVPLNAGPDRLWRSLFLEQAEYRPDFVPILVRFTYHPPAANFQSEEWQLKECLRLLDLWIESTNRRCLRTPRRPADQEEDEELRESEDADGN